MTFKILLFNFLLVTTCFLTHCGQESTGDIASRDQDRDRERLNLLDRQNKIINGLYQGKTATADIFLSLEATRLSNSNNAVTPYLVPNPSIAGSLVISPKINTAATSQRVQYAFPFSDGTYDPRGGDANSPGGTLAVTLEKTGTPSNINCKVSATHVLTCTWNISANTKFTLKPATKDALSILANENQPDYFYVGQNDKLNVVIQFENSVVPRDGSQIPQPSVTGYIVFFDKTNQRSFPTESETQSRYRIKGGVPDILGGQISVVIDDNFQVNMECKILKEGATLTCHWDTRVPQTFTVNRTVRR